MHEYVYQQEGRFIAQVAGGFEPLAADELTALGMQEVTQGLRVIYFNTDLTGLFRVTYCARLVTRILAPLVSFTCNDRTDLYRQGRAIEWQGFFSPRQTFSVMANVSGNPNMRQNNFAALCLKDAVVDYFRDISGDRPNVQTLDPDIILNIHILGKRGTISLDASGGSLHRRGYRQSTVAAPMQETLAAAMVALSGWSGEKPLYDPMCGSGTLLCEALMAYCRIPAGYLRPTYGFRHLPDFDRNGWKTVKKEADSAIRPLPEGLIGGSDISAEAVRATRANCHLLPSGDRIRIGHKDFKNIDRLADQIILCNPPYGIRLESETDLPLLYKELGDFLKHRCPGSDAYLFFGNREMLKSIGLRPAWKKPMKNAELDGRVAKFSLWDFKTPQAHPQGS
jgi:putative N6-adenine-specific DNA methylase